MAEEDVTPESQHVELAQYLNYALHLERAPLIKKVL
jgi:hypothetical protein